MKLFDIDVEEQYDGSLLLSTIYKGQYIKCRYYYYTERQAKSNFRKLVIEVTNKVHLCCLKI
jgi:hypothetical protein